MSTRRELAAWYQFITGVLIVMLHLGVVILSGLLTDGWSAIVCVGSTLLCCLVIMLTAHLASMVGDWEHEPRA